MSHEKEENSIHTKKENRFQNLSALRETARDKTIFSALIYMTQKPNAKQQESAAAEWSPTLKINMILILTSTTSA